MKGAAGAFTGPNPERTAPARIDEATVTCPADGCARTVIRPRRGFNGVLRPDYADSARKALGIEHRKGWHE